MYHHRTQRTGVEGVHIESLISALREKGHDVIEVALLVDRGSDPVQITGEDERNRRAGFLGWFAHRAPNVIFRIAELSYNMVAFVKCLRAVRANKIDCIYERYAYFLFAGVAAAKVSGRPIILEVNIVTDLEDVRKLRFRSLARFIEQRVLYAADAIFVVSEYLREKLIARGIDGNKVLVQPNAFTIRKPQPRDTPVLESMKRECYKRTIIGFLGRLLPWYQLDVLLATFASLNLKHPDSVLLFIGHGPEREKLEVMVLENQLVGRVIFSGEMLHADALALLEIVDIGVIPATNVWGSPMKLFEYMGIGIPVVAPDIEVIRAIVSDEVNGKLFPLGNFEQFKRKIEELLSDPALRKRMGAAASRTIREKHTWVHVAEHVVRMAEAVLEKRAVDCGRSIDRSHLNGNDRPRKAGVTREEARKKDVG